MDNDPYTAIQSIDAIEGLLRRLTGLHLDTSVIHGVGQARVRLLMPNWEAFLRVGVDELAHAGQGIPTVRHRLCTLLDGVIAISPPGRVPMLEHRRDQLIDR